jgi:hypothetical protein
LEDLIWSLWDLASERGPEGVLLKLGLRPLEKVVEEWIANHLDVLEPIVGSLELATRDGVVAGHQIRLDGGASVPDLICRRSVGTGWVVIELKRGAAGAPVLDQIDRYLDAVRVELARPGETVEGVIGSDGSRAALRARLAQRPDVQHVNLALLGYHDNATDE